MVRVVGRLSIFWSTHWSVWRVTSVINATVVNVSNSLCNHLQLWLFLHLGRNLVVKGRLNTCVCIKFCLFSSSLNFVFFGLTIRIVIDNNIHEFINQIVGIFHCFCHVDVKSCFILPSDWQSLLQQKHVVGNLRSKIFASSRSTLLIDSNRKHW